MALKTSAEAGRKHTVNKGSAVRPHCPPSNGLPSDQVVLSSPSRSSSEIPLGVQSADPRSEGTKASQLEPSGMPIPSSLKCKVLWTSLIDECWD